MKTISYIITLILGVMIGMFVCCSLIPPQNHQSDCKEFIQIDEYDGNIRITYVPELNKCIKL